MSTFNLGTLLPYNFIRLRDETVQVAWTPEGKKIDLNKKTKTNTWLSRIQTKQCNTIHYMHYDKYTIKENHKDI